MDAGISAAGKTGTADENKLRSAHALFPGYAPYEKPEIAIATRSATDMLPDYAQISCKVLQYYFNPDKEEDILMVRPASWKPLSIPKIYVFLKLPKTIGTGADMKMQ